MSYIHLHVHGHQSKLDGAMTEVTMVQRVKELNQEAIALTDHGNLGGIIKFWDVCKKENIIPIIGFEAYLAPEDHRKKEPIEGMPNAFHLTLLAQNLKGLKNLYKLSSLAYTEGFYYKPRVSHELLRRYNNDIICLSGCFQGKIQWALHKHFTEEDNTDYADVAKSEIATMKDIFGDRFYMEIQRIIPEQESIIRAQKELCQEYNIKPVATCDSHYARPEDAEFHEQILCLSTGKKLTDENRMGRMDNLYLKSEDEMRNLFSDWPEAVDNTVEVYKKCKELSIQEPFKRDKWIIPKTSDNDDELFRTMTKEGLKKKGLDKNPKYINQINYELNVICDMGFSSYFLLVRDYVKWAKDNGILVGSGRGSVAGSCVSYCLEITDVDPIEAELIFERFLNPGRMGLLDFQGITDKIPTERMTSTGGSPPDIDTDFPKGTGEKVEQYIINKYGQNKVAKIPTYATFKPRGAVKDFNRVLGNPVYLGNNASKLVPAAVYGKEPKWKDVRAQAPELYEGEFKKGTLAAEKSEGMIRHSGIHAAGMVISEGDITDIAPVMVAGPDKVVVAQFDMEELERLGLVKMDILKIATLKWIETCFDYIKETQGTTLTLEGIPLDDKKTFDLISRGNTNGLFQLDGGGGIRDLCIQLQPRSISDLSAISALYRPGPIEGGLVDSYVKRKKGEEAVTYLIPELEPILKDTYGVWVYQESVIRATVDLAGYNLVEADIFRKIIGKKKVDLIEKQKKKFIDGCVKNKIEAKHAEQIFSEVQGFSSYAFNRAHSYSYSVITYYTAYLKANYPLEYHCSLLTNHHKERDKLMTYLSDCKQQDIQVLPPDINESNVGFTVTNGVIRFGLSAIKGVGVKACKSIIQARKKGPFTSLLNFYDRIEGRGINRRVVESLTKAGAFNSLDISRAGIMHILDDLTNVNKEQEKYEKKILTYEKRLVAYHKREEEREAARAQGRKGKASLKMPVKPEPPAPIEVPEMDELDLDDILELEKETLGIYITSHPLYAYEREILQKTNAHTTSLADCTNGEHVQMIGVISSVRHLTTRAGKKMAIIDMEDLYGHIEVAVFSRQYITCSHVLEESNVILLNGRVEHYEEQVNKVIATRITKMPSKKKPKEPKCVKIILNQSNHKLTEDKLTEVANIIKICPGKIKTYIQLQVGNEQLKLLSEVDKISMEGIKQLKKQQDILVKYS